MTGRSTVLMELKQLWWWGAKGLFISLKKLFGIWFFCKSWIMNTKDKNPVHYWRSSYWHGFYAFSRKPNWQRLKLRCGRKHKIFKLWRLEKLKAKLGVCRVACWVSKRLRSIMFPSCCCLSSCTSSFFPNRRNSQGGHQLDFNRSLRKRPCPMRKTSWSSNESKPIIDSKISNIELIFKIA